MAAETKNKAFTFSGEWLYAIYLTSGILKGVYLSKGIDPGIDLTAITGGVLIALMAKRLFRSYKVLLEQRTWVRVLPVFGFYLLCVLSLLYTPSEHYVYIKLGKFLTNFIALLYPMANRDFRVEKFTGTIILIATALGIYSIVVYGYYFTARGHVLGHDLHFYRSYYLDVGYLLGLAFILSLTIRNVRWKLIVANVILVLMWGTAARGPIIFVVLVYSLYLLYYFKTKGKSYFMGVVSNVKKVIGVLVVVNAVFFIISFNNPFLSTVFKRTLYRFSLMVPDDMSKTIRMAQLEADNPELAAFMRQAEMEKQQSNTARLEHYVYAVKMITKNTGRFLFGYGFGSYGIIKEGTDGRLYPHNIFLEIWFETGLLGVLIFVSFLFQVFYWTIKNERYIIGLAIIYLMLNTFKSYSLIDHRILMGVIGIGMFVRGDDLHMKPIENLAAFMKRYSLLLKYAG